ncbi:VOC family protein [Microbispora bryophytorum]|uniref:VOC family protein n=1 Tax=Microbispora bryophytorum subsp. camponoti TaxID=1677852 RepID=A0ABR8LDH3_9ACTN|nr:VOC family protein [Microbispora camponoti]MBD3146836.1 VOC family protein [Microbispora camponoti]
MLEISTMTIDCAQPYALAQWWSEALGWPLVDSAPEDDEVVLDRPDGPPHLLFIRVPDGKTVKNRLHLDVVPSGDGTRDQEAERLLALGAASYEDHRTPDGAGWVTLLDPEGNEFCVCRSAAEREAGA